MMRNTVLRVGLAAAGVALAGCAAPVEPPSRPPNVLLVVLDTLRADAVHGYSAPQRQTPTLAALAREGALFTQARSTSAWTVPAHASIFTGRYPSRHGAHHEGGALPGEALTLAELLADTHDTAAFVENPHLTREKRFDQGFAVYRNTWRMRRHPATDALPTHRLVRRWLAGRTGERPFFLFINYMTPHLPYRPPPAYEQRFAGAAVDPALLADLRSFGDREARLFIAGRLALSPPELELLRRLYAAEVAFVDARLRMIIAALRRGRQLDETLVVVTSDHGENLGDHGLMEHQFCLYETLLRVPLVMRLPGRIAAATRRDDPVQLVDLFPTVLEAAGVPRERWPPQEGASLLGAPLPAERPVVAEYMLPHEQRRIFASEIPDFDFAPLFRRLRSLQIGSEKLIVAAGGRPELYDLASDPGELTNLAAERPQAVRRLAERLQRWLEAGLGPLDPEAVELGDETLEALRSLGYVE